MKRLIEWVLALGCLWVGVAKAGVDIQHWVSPSGAKVYLVESHSLPMLDLQVDFAAGSATDPPDKAGLAGLNDRVPRIIAEAGHQDQG